MAPPSSAMPCDPDEAKKENAPKQLPPSEMDMDAIMAELEAGKKQVEALRARNQSLTKTLSDMRESKKKLLDKNEQEKNELSSLKLQLHEQTSLINHLQKEKKKLAETRDSLKAELEPKDKVHPEEVEESIPYIKEMLKHKLRDKSLEEERLKAEIRSLMAQVEDATQERDELRAKLERYQKFDVEQVQEANRQVKEQLKRKIEECSKKEAALRIKMKEVFDDRDEWKSVAHQLKRYLEGLEESR